MRNTGRRTRGGRLGRICATYCLAALTAALGMGYQLARSDYAQMRMAAFWNPALDPFGYGWGYAHLRAGEVPYTSPDLLLAAGSPGPGRWGAVRGGARGRGGPPPVCCVTAS